jgi:DNA-binding response OmpR family regulator
MHLSCLVVSRDPEVLKGVGEVFSGLDIVFRRDVAGANEAINQNHLDAFVIDCDGVEGSTDLLGTIRNSRSNRNSVIFTLVNGTTTISTVTELGANFVLGKPVDQKRLTTYLQASIRKMEAEHRRYFRYQLALDAEVLLRDGQNVAAQILNVSQGGLAMRLLDRAHLYGPVTIEFNIPGIRKSHVAARAAASWSTERLFGMRYLSMDSESREAYDRWLNSMELS